MDDLGITIENPVGAANNLGELITQFLNIAIGAAALLSVFVLIFSGYMYITASGDETKIEKASKSLTYAIVGLAIAFIAVLLVNFVLKDLLGAEGVTMLSTVLV
jgi:TRAP-type C4-dicarboxylate transport system permease small subunit